MFQWRGMIKLMKFHIITIFPQIFESYFGESIISRATKKNIIGINIINLRDFTTDKHRTVDDTPYGGGAGMIFKIEPIYKAIEKIKSDIKSKVKSKKLKVQLKSQKFDEARVILFSAKGKKFTQTDVRRLAKYENLILICGRYEGVDERVTQYIADEEISIGDYVLTGGEIPAMIIVDSITRLLPGVLGNTESIEEESHNKTGTLEYPQYTKPEDFMGHNVPKILLSGNHAEIKKWKKDNAKVSTNR